MYKKQIKKALALDNNIKIKKVIKEKYVPVILDSGKEVYFILDEKHENITTDWYYTKEMIPALL